jgi:hypothetical protein
VAEFLVGRTREWTIFAKFSASWTVAAVRSSSAGTAIEVRSTAPMIGIALSVLDAGAGASSNTGGAAAAGSSRRCACVSGAHLGEK